MEVAPDLACFNEQLAAFAESGRWRSAMAALRSQARISLKLKVKTQQVSDSYAGFLKFGVPFWGPSNNDYSILGSFTLGPLYTFRASTT